MADLMNAFPSKYLKASDVGDDMVPATILSVEQIKIGDEIANIANLAENLAADGTNKGMRLNVTNSREVARLAGSGDTDQIRNLPVIVFAVQTQDKSGSPCKGLRIRKGNARSEAAQQAADIADETFGGTGTEDNEAAF